MSASAVALALGHLQDEGTGQATLQAMLRIPELGLCAIMIQLPYTVTLLTEGARRNDS